MRDSKSPIAGDVSGFPNPIQISWPYKPGYMAQHKFLDLHNGTGFEECLKSHPRIALQLVTLSSDQFGSTPIQRLVSTPEGAKKVAELCFTSPQELARMPESWGRLLQICESVAPVREALILAAAEWEPHSPFREVYPFILNLPQESLLLPPILNAIVNRQRPIRHLPKSRPISEMIRDFVPDPGPLLPLISSEAEPADVRSSAVIMCLLHPNCPKERSTDFIRMIVRNYKPHANSWYLRMAAAALEALIDADDIRALEAMGSLLRARGGDFKGRLGLSSVFERWRQRSKAPVSQHGISNFLRLGLA
jgi:hypothetical protein